MLIETIITDAPFISRPFLLFLRRRTRSESSPKRHSKRSEESLYSLWQEILHFVQDDKNGKALLAINSC